MPYQVKSGALTIVVPTVAAALKIFDDWINDGKEKVSIRDMDGRLIDPETLRSRIADE